MTVSHATPGRSTTPASPASNATTRQPARAALVESAELAPLYNTGPAVRLARAGRPPLVQRCACGGSCPACRAKEELKKVEGQTKLTISSPGDPLELEADRVA